MGRRQEEAGEDWRKMEAESADFEELNEEGLQDQEGSKKKTKRWKVRRSSRSCERSKCKGAGRRDRNAINEESSGAAAGRQFKEDKTLSCHSNASRCTRVAHAGLYTHVTLNGNFRWHAMRPPHKKSTD